MEHQNILKERAATRAVELVPDGADIGLGSGSTAEIALRLLGERVRDGLRLRGVPTSERTATLARSFGIPLTTLDDTPELALTLDGADEVDPDLNLIKGLGGALTREKIVAKASNLVVILVDESKLVRVLGTGALLPVEVLPFGWMRAATELDAMGLSPEQRMTADGDPYITDNGNYLLHLPTGPIANPRLLDTQIRAVAGVVETGLFIGIAGLVLVGAQDGVREMRNHPAPGVA
ncbi:MAG: ribose-5-phosphate isomerase RpiA [Chloroflexota bacterium]|nr:ribose-5-phosphate isomerase RpiA [Chloroflexota bacterium]